MKPGIWYFTLSMLIACVVSLSVIAAPATDEDATIAASLAQMLRSARVVIAESQAKIDDPAVGDKGLSGRVVLDLAIQKYQATTGVDPASIDPKSRQGVLLQALKDAIVEVMDESQPQINAKGTGFKGFIPAVFARLVDEAFARHAKGEAEAEVITTKLLQANWPKGQPFSAVVQEGRPAFRIMVPEYYAESCLSCHGVPKGEMDKTGYPKEGGKVGDLGAVISITLYH